MHCVLETRKEISRLKVLGEVINEGIKIMRSRIGLFDRIFYHLWIILS